MGTKSRDIAWQPLMGSSSFVPTRGTPSRFVVIFFVGTRCAVGILFFYNVRNLEMVCHPFFPPLISGTGSRVDTAVLCPGYPVLCAWYVLAPLGQYSSDGALSDGEEFDPFCP